MPHIVLESCKTLYIPSLGSFILSLACSQVLHPPKLEYGSIEDWHEDEHAPVDQVIKSGTGLAFISYPSAIAKFDYVPQLFAVLFFLMLVTLGLGSATGLTSAVIAIIADNKPSWNKTYVTGAVCISGFLIGLVYLTPVSFISNNNAMGAV